MPDKLPAAKARFISPMKPRLVVEPPLVGDWIYELKFDGIRLIAIKQGNKVKLTSRNGNELSARFPEIAAEIKELAVRDCVLDGEVVALDAKGRSSFQLLQGQQTSSEPVPLYYYVFDLLQADGKSLVRQPLVTRKAALKKLCGSNTSLIRYSSELAGTPGKLLREVKRLGLEGLIGKQRGSVYEPGSRSGAWIKLKVVNEQEFVIGGYTPPAGSRKYFGALLVGYYQGNKLLFAGKVGTGFNTRLLGSLHAQLKTYLRTDSPFFDLNAGTRIPGAILAMMRQTRWVNPVMVGQIKYAEWTREGKLRQPVFLGLREDKAAREVTRQA